MSAVDSVVRAVLYEGYMLYPYRPSSVKNRQRWTFGGVYPQAWVEASASDPWAMQTECIVEGGADALIGVRPGFLHLVEREVLEFLEPLPHWPDWDHSPARKVEMLQIDDRLFYAWQEAIERQVVIAPARLADLGAPGLRIPFAFAGCREREPLFDNGDMVRGALVRTRESLDGYVELTARPLSENTWRLTVRIVNVTPLPDVANVGRALASLRALVSCHTVLEVSGGGEFVSSLDPPRELADAVAECRNIGLWPVLVGDEGQRDTLLASPIILYDYPQVAPESAGDLFDATEIDEILTLRILAMTDQEKGEMAAVDERARALLERTENLTPEQMQRLHGTFRRLHPLEIVAPMESIESCASFEAIEPYEPFEPAEPFEPFEQSERDETPFDGPWAALETWPRLACLRVAGVEIQVGHRVRLRPHGNADIFDLALSGQLATIESIERDFEDRIHVAVTVDSDPGKDFGIARMPGHRFFFAPDEIEPLAATDEGRRRPE